LVTLLLLSIIALWKLHTANGHKIESELRSYQAQQQSIVQILNAAYQRALSLHNMSIQQDPFAKDATFIRFRDFGQKLIVDREFLSASNTTEEEWNVWRDIRDTLNDGGALQYQIIDAMDNDKNDFAQVLLVTKLQPLQEHLQQSLHTLSQVKEKKLLQRQSKLQQVDRNVTALMYVLGLVAGVLGVFTTVWIRRSTKVELALVKQASQYKALYAQSAAQEISPEQQIRESMRLLCEFLDMDSAKLSKVDIRRRQLTYVEIVDLTDSLTGMEKNNVVSLDKTMSSLCADKSEPIFVQNVSTSMYSNHQFYESSNTGSFIGTGLIVSGQPFGYLSFFRRQPRNLPFSNAEVEVLQLATKWICATLQSQSSLKLQIENKANQQSSDFESRFYSNINHEMRTPLNAVIGYAELLLTREDGAEEKSEEILRKIRQSGHHLLSLVDNILDLTKLETGKVNISVEEIDIMSTVNAVAETLDYVFLQTNTKFICNQFLGSMRTDKEKFQHILLNLIENICQYSKQSEITMKISNIKANGEDYISFSLSGSIGLQNLASKLLDIVNESARRHWDYGRMEMGFSLCHRYSKILGGSLSVSENSGRTPVFHLRLPKYLQRELVLANVS